MFIYSYCSLWVHTSTPGADCSVMSSGTQGANTRKEQKQGRREITGQQPIGQQKKNVKEESKMGVAENASKPDKKRVRSSRQDNSSFLCLRLAFREQTNHPQLERTAIPQMRYNPDNPVKQ